MPRDKDTEQILTEADHVRSMLGSDGWKYVKDKFDTKVLDLQNIHNLDYTDVNSLATQLAARKMAVQYMSDWYFKDVLGFVEQQEANNRPKPVENEPFIEQH